ncbi:MAG: thioredoxin domain-containing protein, partial [Proteobacteria bacterium]|nr:thioredoxin domain-containing protein [Pseudomonadota bacterium]
MPLLEQVLEKYPNKVKIVHKNFPLSMHKFAGLAATASMAANEQGKFWPYHDMLFENYNRLNETVVREIAEKVGLNIKRFDESLKDPQIRG